MYVCTDCIGDEHLAVFIRRNSVNGACDYCDRSHNEISPLLVVLDFMMSRVSSEWSDPIDELPFDSGEGGYQGEVYSASDLLEHLGYAPESNRLYEDVVEAFSDHEWCHRDYFALREDERLATGWTSFASAIKHLRRYTFWTMGDVHSNSEYHPDFTPIGTLLREIGDCAIAAGLIRVIPDGEQLWRVRVHDAEEQPVTGEELGSPPRQLANQPNRMSPEGVSMFYGASDFETACQETIDPVRTSQRVVTGGAFVTTKQIYMLDLFDLPPLPSFWAADGMGQAASRFLRRFRKEISRPIERGRSHHLEYIPTQAFTEFVRFGLKTRETESISAVRYPSSRNGRPCYVVFADNAQCSEAGSHHDCEQVLRLDTTSIRRMTVSGWDDDAGGGPAAV